MTKETGDTEVSFSVPIYDFKFKIVITSDMSRWASDNPLRGSMATAESCEALFIPGDKVVTIVLKPKAPQNHLAHEIGHAARFIMNYIGFNITAENDEPLAYLEDFLHLKSEHVLRKLLDKTGKKAENNKPPHKAEGIKDPNGAKGKNESESSSACRWQAPKNHRSRRQAVRHRPPGR